MSATKDIDEEIDREILEMYRDKVSNEYQKARNMVASWQEQVDRLERKMERVDERLYALTTPLPAAPPVTGKSGRVKKGASQEVIETFLKASNGLGATIGQIVKGTGTTISTARRVLVNFEKEEKVTHGDDARWKWKTPMPATPNLFG